MAVAYYEMLIICASPAAWTFCCLRICKAGNESSGIGLEGRMYSVAGPTADDKATPAYNHALETAMDGR